ncbi:hypothetical protein EDB84DRAFT_1583293, partial [Lactarius hengduanensis]
MGSVITSCSLCSIVFYNKDTTAGNGCSVRSPLMPFLKHARGRYVPPAQPVTTPNEFPACGRVTIGELSDDCLLNIFRYYLDVSPRRWPRLVHICRRWRRIVLTYQRALHLQMF